MAKPKIQIDETTAPVAPVAPEVGTTPPAETPVVPAEGDEAPEVPVGVTVTLVDTAPVNETLETPYTVQEGDSIQAEGVEGDLPVGTVIEGVDAPEAPTTEETPAVEETAPEPVVLQLADSKLATQLLFDALVDNKLCNVEVIDAKEAKNFVSVPEGFDGDILRTLIDLTDGAQPKATKDAIDSVHAFLATKGESVKINQFVNLTRGINIIFVG